MIQQHNEQVYWTASVCPPADWRGAGFPSEGANRPHQTPARPPGAGDRQLRHGELAAGLRKPGHPGPSQGRLQMRSPLLWSMAVAGLSPTFPLLLLDLTWQCRCSLLLTPSLKHIHMQKNETKKDIKQLHIIGCFLGCQKELTAGFSPPEPSQSHLAPPPCLSWCHRMTKNKTKQKKTCWITSCSCHVL